MNWQDIKNIIKEELKEATTVSAGNTKFNLRTGVNKNPTKLGIKIQFEPKAGGLESDTKSKLEVALQEKLNDTLKEYDIQVSKDTDVPREDVLGFFIPLSQIKNMIIKSVKGPGTPPPAQGTPPPPRPTPPPTPTKSEPVTETIDKMISEELIKEMRQRTLNEISKIVMREDFYGFINAGNNMLRSLEERGYDMMEAKKYLGYLVKHNIM